MGDDQHGALCDLCDPVLIQPLAANHPICDAGDACDPRVDRHTRIFETLVLVDHSHRVAGLRVDLDPRNAELDDPIAPRIEARGLDVDNENGASLGERLNSAFSARRQAPQDAIVSVGFEHHRDRFKCLRGRRCGDVGRARGSRSGRHRALV